MYGPHPEKPEYEILLLSHNALVSVARNSVAKQPESKCASKYINVFLGIGRHCTKET